MTAAVFLGCSLQAKAVQTGGTIRVSLDAGELPVTNGALRLYMVGIPESGGYRILECFGGGIVKQEDADSPHLAQWLAEAAGESGHTVNLDVDGNVCFSNLEPGLYLITQPQRMDGFYPIQPFLVAIPGEGEQYIQAYPKTEPIIADNPRTGQPVTPLLGAMGMVISGVGLYLCADKKRKNSKRFRTLFLGF